MSLIQRLDALTGPDREVDMQVALAVGHEAKFIPYDPHSRQMSSYGWLERSSRNSEWKTLALYTASIDAALTLVPDGWEWNISNRARHPHTGRAYIHNRHNHFVGVGFRPNPDYVSYEFTAATTAIAFCIAALKARGVK